MKKKLHFYYTTSMIKPQNNSSYPVFLVFLANVDIIQALKIATEAIFVDSVPPPSCFKIFYQKKGLVPPNCFSRLHLDTYVQTFSNKAQHLMYRNHQLLHVYKAHHLMYRIHPLSYKAHHLRFPMYNRGVFALFCLHCNQIMLIK